MAKSRASARSFRYLRVQAKALTLRERPESAALSCFREITEHVEDVLYVRELDGSIIFVSPAYQRNWGFEPLALYEQRVKWEHAIDPRDRQRLRSAYSNMLKGDPFDEEYRILLANGSTRLVRERAFAVEDRHGAIKRHVGIVQDITAERELEEELRQAQKMEAMGTLASGIAHDFRNLLQGMMGCAQLALRDETASEQTRTHLRQLLDSARRGASLTSQLMRFSRKEEASLRPLSADQVIQQMTPLMERLLGEHIELNLALGAPHARVMADPVQVQQILMNLAANARDAMPQGGTFSVETSTARPSEVEAQRLSLPSSGPCLRLLVRDTGVGMDAETQSRVFEPFFTTKVKGRGTGLGLSTVFGIVRTLKGHIRISSEPGQGTAFIFHFTCTSRVPEIVAEAQDLPRFDGTALLLEDEPLVRMTIRHYLQDLGFKVLEAADVAAAEALYDAEPEGIDVLVSDVMLPGALGSTFGDQLQKRSPGLRVLYVSAQPRRQLRAKNLISADALVLAKPFDKRDLALKLQSLIERPSGSMRKAGRSGSFSAAEDVREGDALLCQRQSDIRELGAIRGVKTILVAEDSGPAREALWHILQSRGYDVFQAASPAEAFAITERHPVDLAVTSSSFSGRTGTKLARALRRRWPQLKILIALTSEPPAELGEEFVFVKKPIDADELVATIERLGSEALKLQVPRSGNGG